MSMIQCQRCDRMVDSDDDPDVFVERPNYTNTAMPANPKHKEREEWDVLCEGCREMDDDNVLR